MVSLIKSAECFFKQDAFSYIGLITMGKCGQSNCNISTNLDHILHQLFHILSSLPYLDFPPKCGREAQNEKGRAANPQMSQHLSILTSSLCLFL